MSSSKYLRSSKLLIISIVCVTGLLGPTPPAGAETRLHLSIPAQSLDGALSAVGDAAGLQLSYPGALSKGIRTRQLSGDYTPDEALGKLLAGTGLTYQYTAANTVTIEPAPKTAPSEPQSATLGKVTVSAEARYDANDPYNKSYTVTNSSTATKTDTPLFDTPVSVSIVPKAVLQDQKTVRLKDALQNISSVRATTTGSSGNRFLIRGFSNVGLILRNTLNAVSNRDFRTEFDSYNIERVEVLKGPGSVLYGRTQPGGLINVLTKRPFDTPYYALEQRFGSFDLYRTELDATGPLLADQSLLYRVTGAYENSGSFRDFVHNERIAINPSLTWRPTVDTEWTVEVEHIDIDYSFDSGIPVIGRRVLNVPIGRSYSDPNDPQDFFHQTYVGSDFTHRFNTTWTLHHRFLASLATGRTSHLGRIVAIVS